MAQSNARVTGTVKFFNASKGFGFIIPNDLPVDEEPVDIFVHHSAIFNNGGFRSLGEGEIVEFDTIHGAKGIQATNVTGPGGMPVKGGPHRTYSSASTSASSTSSSFHSSGGQTRSSNGYPSRSSQSSGNFRGYMNRYMDGKCA